MASDNDDVGPPQARVALDHDHGLVARDLGIEKGNSPDQGISLLFARALEHFSLSVRRQRDHILEVELDFSSGQQVGEYFIGPEAGMREQLGAGIVEDLAIYDAPRAADGTVTSQPPVRFPAIYGDPLRSPLQVTVNADNQPCSLELKSR